MTDATETSEINNNNNNKSDFNSVLFGPNPVLTEDIKNLTTNFKGNRESN